MFLLSIEMTIWALDRVDAQEIVNWLMASTGQETSAGPLKHTPDGLRRHHQPLDYIAWLQMTGIKIQT
ncbi:uncharacterized protein LOC122818178 isoform X2 [Drosophila biarmipes]|uniref:uncharacterized protein LOC122818178 isoform X2 n=1 Tax=Drosophila biarmipes TaxID=125945 RepID=UPI001CDB19F4|nr:uncharacterized protein LOC122818178 isoform X2 [Drosophila biarmipes]